MTDTDTDTDTDRRLAELEARVVALEASIPAAGGASGAGQEPAEVDDSGEVRYGGTVRLHGEVEWNIHYSPAGVLEFADAPAAAVLAALGHPSRIAVVRRLLTGPATARELVEAAGLSSTGQLYHHLRSLTTVRFVEQDTRGSYRMPPSAVVPALVLMLAAADVSGRLR